MNYLRTIKILICLAILTTISFLVCDTLLAQSADTTEKPVVQDVQNELKQPTTDVRIWTSVQDTTVEAELTGIEDGKALLKKKNGVMLKVPLTSLSTADRTLIEELQNPQPAVEKTQPATADKPMLQTPPATKSGTPKSMTEPKTDPKTTDPKTTDPKMGDGNTTTPETDVPKTADPKSNDPNKPALVTTDPNSPTKPGDEKNAKTNFSALPIAAKARLTNVAVEDVNKLPPKYRSIGQILHTEKDPFKTRAALKELKQVWSGAERNQTMVDLVNNKSMSDDKFTRELALELIITNDPAKSFAFIMQRIDDPSTSVRSMAYAGIKSLRYTNAIGPVAARLAGPDGATSVKSVLLSFGSLSELPIHDFLDHEEKDVRMRACSLLNKIGTEKSVAALQKVTASEEEDIIVQLQAKGAIKNIRKRMLKERPTTLGPGAPTSNDR